MKRLHDRDKSGRLIVLYYWVPGMLERLADRAGDIIGMLLGALALGITVWAIVDLGFRRGTVGPNRYGSDPLDDRPDAAVPLTR